MNLQYITNTAPPPAQSVLQYSINPDTVFVSTATQPMYANLTITVFNPQSESVTCQMFQFGFHVGAADGDLTTSASGIETSSDRGNWTIAQQATESPDDPTLYYYSAPASGMANRQLAPQESLVFHLNGILINEAVGEGGAAIVIKEVTGTRDNPTVIQGEITITKEESRLSAQLSVVPATPVQAGAPVTLNWQVTGSDHWQLYDYDTDTLLYDSKTGGRPNADSYGPVYPQQNTNYALIAYAGQLFTTSYADAMVMAAHFIGPPTATPPVINPGQSSVLSWETKYASQLTISAGDFQAVVLNAPEGQYDYFPQAPNNQWPVSPTETTNYSLAITGPGATSDQRYVPVSVNVPPPVINSFTASTMRYTSGQSVTLQWETSNSSSATLSQKILATGETTSFGSVPNVEPNYPVTPPGSVVIYTLSVVGQGGEVTSHVLVVESAGTFNSLGGQSPSAMIFDGTYLWVCAYNLLKIRPSDGAVLGQYTVNISVSGALDAMVFDGANIWISNDGNTVSKVRPSDGTMLGQYPVPGGNPGGMVFDGENIWVVNDAGVAKLRASDGTVLGQYPQGGMTLALAFDGENIWMTNDKSVLTKLRASDGSLLGNYDVGLGIWDVIFDGTHIWVSNIGNGNVSKLRPGDGTVLGTFPAGSVPYKLLSQAGYIWTADPGDDSVSILDANTGALRGTISISQQPQIQTPQILACDGTYFWVANAQACTLMKL
jgi:hypothetical protein